uniref:Peptidase S1 domain-containing protein n=1 Tax=Angiostrongylus cantonensis TaxID=6313 RepID=A0A0K0DHN9_ANGCA
LSDLQSVELTKIFGGPPKTITMGAFDKSVCNGDRGCPLVRIDKDIYTVTGIAIAVIPSCSTRDSRSDGFIIDVVSVVELQRVDGQEVRKLQGHYQHCANHQKSH